MTEDPRRDDRDLLVRAGDPPRVAWYTAYRRLLSSHRFPLLFGLAWIPAPTILFVVFWFVFGSPLAERRLDQDGARVQGPVTDVRLNSNVSVNGEHPYRVNYEFLDLGGKKYTGSCDIFGKGQANELQRRGVCTIVYLADDPAVNKLEGASYALLPWWVFVLILAFAMFGWVPLAHALVSPLGAALLFRNGVATMARVESIRPSGGTAELALTFQTRRPEEVRTLCRSVPLSLCKALEEGQEVAILYDPRKPVRVALLRRFREQIE
ncbi:MAG: hypothetical protein HY815_10990 [Candidatus Riflebacteria bacterium]|nr:hypothetical protein [Candidatus Riflebacteria bacterium]